MAFAIKYYGEFTDSMGLARARGNIFTGWNNINYSTFIAAGTQIIAAVCSAAASGVGNVFSITSGNTVNITATLTPSTGELPYMRLVYIDSGIQSLSDPVQLASGANTISLTATATRADARLQIYNTAAAEWALGATTMENEQPHDWKIDILQDGFAGTASEMQMSGTPLNMEWPSTSDDLHDQSIRGSAASIGVYCTEDFQYSDLFTSDNLEYKVNIYNGATLFWTGWITANAWQEPYAMVPYPIVISATDGLGILKDFDFDDLQMTRRTGSYLIYDILSTIGFTEFTEYMNIYDAAMDATTDDSPLDQATFNVWVFDGMTKYEALEELLRTFNAAIIQSWGELIIYRYLELGDTLMYGRKFTDATTKSSVTYDPAQCINRPLDPSDFEETGKGSYTVIPKIKTFTITQDFGDRESILWNHTFNYKDFNDVANSIDGWTRYDDATFEPLFNTLGEENGVLLTNAETSFATTNRHIYQTVGTGRDGSDRIHVKFDYGFVNSQLTAQSGSMYMYIGASTFNSGAASRAPGWSGWISTEGYIDDIAGDITVKLYAGVNASGYIKVAFRNLEITFTKSNYSRYTDRDYEVTNATYGQLHELEYLIGDGDILLDNNALQYNGVICVDNDTPTGWSTRGYTQNDLLVELIGGEIGGQFNRPKQLVDLSLYELNDSFFKIFGRLEDYLNRYNDGIRIFAVTRANYDVKNRLWDLTLNEGISRESLYLLDDSGDTITNDADLLIEITAY